MNCLFSISLGLGLILLTSACTKSQDTPTAVDLPASLKTLRMAHPRLFLTDEKLNELQQLRKTDATLNQYINARTQAGADWPSATDCEPRTIVSGIAFGLELPLHGRQKVP